MHYLGRVTMSKTFVELLSYCEPALCLLALVALIRAREHRSFTTLTALLSVRLVGGVTCLALLEAGARHILSRRVAYDTYFYVYWFCFAVQSLLSLYVILSIFRLAMAPLKGLRTLGMLVFRWAAGISIALAAAIGFSPHESAVSLLAGILAQLQQITGVITLCLLLFVCFAIKPLGLTFRSRIFGVAMGLGITASIDLIGAAWIAHNPQLYSGVNLMLGMGGILGLLTWSVYFLMPEPKRRIIVLPTTSPFLRWNQISEILGDEPGFVAIAGIPPEVFAPAELVIMARASEQMEALSEFSLESNTGNLRTLPA